MSSLDQATTVYQWPSWPCWGLFSIFALWVLQMGLLKLRRNHDLHETLFWAVSQPPTSCCALSTLYGWCEWVSLLWKQPPSHHSNDALSQLWLVCHLHRITSTYLSTSARFNWKMGSKVECQQINFNCLVHYEIERNLISLCLKYTGIFGGNFEGLRMVCVL